LAGLDAFLDRKTLPATGTYTVFVDPQSADTGQLDVTAYNVPADQTGALAANTPLNAATAVPGQNVAFVYSGTANQRVSLNLTNVTYDRAKVSILKPDGSALFSPALLVTSAGGFLEPKKLPTTGTYTVKVDPEGAYTGAMDVTLYSVPADATATIAANATPVTVSNTVPGQNASLTFANAASKRISLKLTGVTMADTAFSGLKVKILQPDGSTLASATLGTDGKFFDTQSATQTGTYKILLDPQGPVTGSATLTLYTVPADTTAPILANGTPTTIAVATPGQSATLTFSGAANQRVAFRVSKGAVSSLKVSLAKSGSTSYVFFPTSVSVDPQFFDTKSLGASGGTFKITLDPQGDYTGSMTVTLWTVPADATGTLTPGSNNVTLTTGQNARLTFTATAGQTATVTFSSGTIAQAWARILSPTGTQLESSFWDPTVTNSPVTETLTQTGTYTFLLDPVGDKTGSMTFSLSLS